MHSSGGNEHAQRRSDLPLGLSHLRARAALLDLALPLLVYGALTAWFTWPLAALGSNHLVSAGAILFNDLYLVLWMLTWVARALVSDPANVFDGNALHPTPQVIAASEHLLGDMPIFLPIWLATDNAILGLNCLTAASFVLGALGMHWLALRWTGSRTAAYVGGVAFAFAPWRADLGRPHLLQAQYFPLIALGLDRVVHSGRMRTALLTAAALALQVLCSYYLGYAAYLMVGLFLVLWLTIDRGRARLRVWPAIAVAVLAPLLAIVPASLPYLAARSSGALATEQSAPLLAAWEVLGRPVPVLATFAGWGSVVLAVLGLWGLGRAWRDDRTRALRIAFLLVVATSALLLASGPVGLFGGWLAPYAWLAAIVPGFASLRSPIRFGIATGFAVSGLAAYGAATIDAALRQRAPRWARIAAGAIAIAVPCSWMLIAAPSFSGTRLPLRAEISPAHQWLAKHGNGGPLLELPIDPMLHLASARAMFISTYHWLPLVNGYTGYTPAGSAFLLAQAQQLPSPEALQLLVDCAGLEWILVHRASGVRREAWRRLRGVRLEREFVPDRERGEADELFRVVAPRGRGCPGLFAPGATAQGNAIAAVAAPRGSVAAAVPPVLTPNRERLVVLSAQNDGTVPWPATSTDPATRFEMAYAWQPVGGGNPVKWHRVLLPHDVAPGERVEFAAWLASPAEAGSYELRVRAGQGPDPAAPLLWQRTVEVAPPGSGGSS